MNRDTPEWKIPSAEEIENSLSTLKKSGIKFQDINKSFIESSLVSSDRIYLDIHFIKDFQVARYLSASTMTATKYKELREELATYYRHRKQYDYDFVGHDRADDTITDDILFKIAPVTLFFTGWLKEYTTIILNNRAMLDKQKDIIITVNTYPFKLSDNSKKIIAESFLDMYGVQTEVIDTSPEDISVKQWMSYNDIFIWYPNDLLSKPDMGPVLQDLRFFEKRVFAPRFTKSLAVSEQDFEGEEHIVNLYTKFTFLKRDLVCPIVEMSDGEETS